MNDKELADAVVALGVLTWFETVDGHDGSLVNFRGFVGPIATAKAVRDWRVAGALMEKMTWDELRRMFTKIPRLINTKCDPRAIIEAAVEVAKSGKKVIPEIMIPLVSQARELELQREVCVNVAKEVMEEAGVEVDYMIGTMIELPRAALTADEIAKHAEFFSFGTNDLTQTTFGISRDDAEEKFLQDYVEEGIVEGNPFMSVDEKGVGALIIIATEKGRATVPGMEVGICGEHGGDPKSIDFCHRAGLDYVSCSPFRVPTARLAAAHAKLRSEGKME